MSATRGSVEDVIAGRAQWALSLGDCLDAATGIPSLPARSVDHVVSDPPYSDHVHSKSMRGAAGWKGKIAVKRVLGFPPMTRLRLGLTARQFARVARRWVHVFSDVESCHLWRLALDGAEGVEYIRTSGWHKLDGAPQFTGDRAAVAFETITGCHPRGRKRWNGGGSAGWYHVPIVMDRPGTGERRVHTTQKPLKLMLQLLGDYVEPGEIVVDGFAGSATTGAAAIQLGCRFIGWEMDPAVYATACLRLGGEEYKPTPGQLSLLGGVR